MTFETMRLFFGLVTLGANTAVIIGLVVPWPRLTAARGRVLSVLAGRELDLPRMVAVFATLGSPGVSQR